MYTAVHLPTHRGIYYLHVEQFLAVYALMDFLDLLGLLVCFLPLWFGVENNSLVVYHEVGSIPEELLLARDEFFTFSFLVVWLHSISLFVASKNYMITHTRQVGRRAEHAVAAAVVQGSGALKEAKISDCTSTSTFISISGIYYDVWTTNDLLVYTATQAFLSPLAHLHK
jgi:hypothetical protein